MAAAKQGEAVFDEKSERLWPDPQVGPFRMELYWVRRNGRPALVGARLLPMDRATADELTLTTSTWRDVKLAEVASELREQLEYVEPAPLSPELMVEGMRPATVEKLRRAATVYQEAWRAGELPTQAVARQMKVSAGAAGNLVRRAREVGFLPPTSAGVPQA